MKAKKTLFCVLTFALCIMVSVAMAASWVCPSCGESNTGNYCSNCGQKKPSSFSQHTLSNIRVTTQDDGNVVVRWDDSAKTSPYKITYTTAGWNYSWYTSDAYKGTSATLYTLTPGVTYTLTISNANDEVSTEYTVPRPIYTEFATGGKYMSLTKTRFSLSELEKTRRRGFKCGSAGRS